MSDLPNKHAELDALAAEHGILFPAGALVPEKQGLLAEAIAAADSLPPAVAFRCATDVNYAEVAVHDHLVRIEAGEQFETRDMHEIEALEKHPAVERVED